MIKRSDILINHDKEEVLEILKLAYDAGYRYVVRSEKSKYLNCFSLKPKRYKENKDWGYMQKDIDNEKAKSAHLIKNTDMIEINYSNKSATTIASLIGIKE